MQEHLDRPVIGLTYSSEDLEGFLLWRHVFHAFVAAGATPVSIDCATEQRRVRTLVARMDGLVVSGGGDVEPTLYGGSGQDDVLSGVNPARDSSERSAFEEAMGQGMPVLAICRGLQLVNVVLGGTLYADLARDRPRSSLHQYGEEALARPVHDVEVMPGTLLSKWMGVHGTIPVNSEHHQGIRDLAPSLTPVAVSPDGLVEAFEAPSRHLVGVQWHPEILWPYEETSAALLQGFVAECRARTQAGAGR